MKVIKLTLTVYKTTSSKKISRHDKDSLALALRRRVNMFDLLDYVRNIPDSAYSIEESND